MKKLFLKLSLIVLPVLSLVVLFFVADPYKVVYHYDSYYPKDGIQYVVLNNDFTSVETYMQNRKHENYDSYIFGNSKGLIFHIPQWQRHLPASASCFQFSVSNENLFGIERKLNLIDSFGGKINNVLLVIDPAVFGNDAEDKHFAKHPALTGKSMFAYKLNVFRGFFEAGFLPKYLQLLCFHSVNETIFSSELNTHRSVYDVKSNDLIFPDLDLNIDKDSTDYYKKRAAVFSAISDGKQFFPKVIFDKQATMLTRIKKLLDKHHTAYRVVISPPYGGAFIDTSDKRVINSILGSETVFDFSGKNKITTDKHNYYESTHFRVGVANEIMDTVYASDSLKRI